MQSRRPDQLRRERRDQSTPLSQQDISHDVRALPRYRSQMSGAQRAERYTKALQYNAERLAFPTLTQVEARALQLNDYQLPPSTAFIKQAFNELSPEKQKQYWDEYKIHKLSKNKDLDTEPQDGLHPIQNTSEEPTHITRTTSDLSTRNEPASSKRPRIQANNSDISPSSEKLDDLPHHDIHPQGDIELFNSYLRQHGEQVLQVNGDGMNCLIRALLRSGGHNPHDSSFENHVNNARQLINEQGIEQVGDLLNAGGESGQVIIAQLRSQGLLNERRGVSVYTLNNNGEVQAHEVAVGDPTADLPNYFITLDEQHIHFYGVGPIEQNESASENINDKSSEKGVRRVNSHNGSLHEISDAHGSAIAFVEEYNKNRPKEQHITKNALSSLLAGKTREVKKTKDGKSLTLDISDHLSQSRAPEKGVRRVNSHNGSLHEISDAHGSAIAFVEEYNKNRPKEQHITKNVLSSLLAGRTREVKKTKDGKSLTLDISDHFSQSRASEKGVRRVNSHNESLHEISDAHGSAIAFVEEYNKNRPKEQHITKNALSSLLAGKTREVKKTKDGKSLTLDISDHFSQSRASEKGVRRVNSHNESLHEISDAHGSAIAFVEEYNKNRPKEQHITKNALSSLLVGKTREVKKTKDGKSLTLDISDHLSQSRASEKGVRRVNSHNESLHEISDAHGSAIAFVEEYNKNRPKEQHITEYTLSKLLVGKTREVKKTKDGKSLTLDISDQSYK